MDSGSVREGPRTDSPASTANTNPISLPSRSSTLKKKPSLSKKASLRRGGSRKSSRAGSVRSMNLGEKEKYGVAQDEANSAFFVPIPTSGNPTEVLAARFQGQSASKGSTEHTESNMIYSLEKGFKGPGRILPRCSALM